MRKEKIYCFTLGCKVNSYESNAIMNNLLNLGFKKGDEKNFDIAIINTCSVTSTASQKSRQLIHKIRRNNKDTLIVVMGCLMNNKKEYNLDDLDADIILGTNNRNKIIELLPKYNKKDGKIVLIDNYTSLRCSSKFEELGINTYSENTRAYLKIEDGCNNFCSYCIIPFLRGRVRSRSKKQILDETKNLILQGYKEIILTGIDTSSYGKDLKNYCFSDLLEDILINNINLYRLRISSLEISEIDDKFLTLLSKYKNICNHLHIPLQSGDDLVLKRMNRKYNTNQYLNKINKIREIRPDIAITTDLIVGFPGESEEQFNNTLSFLNKISFKEIHVFPYSKRYSTLAYSYKDLDSKIKSNRVNKVIELSNKLKESYESKFIGKKLEVLIEKNNEGQTSNYILLKVTGNPGEIKEVIVKKEDIL